MNKTEGSPKQPRITLQDLRRASEKHQSLMLSGYCFSEWVIDHARQSVIIYIFNNAMHGGSKCLEINTVRDLRSRIAALEEDGDLPPMNITLSINEVLSNFSIFT